MRCLLIETDEPTGPEKLVFLPVCLKLVILQREINTFIDCFNLGSHCCIHILYVVVVGPILQLHTQSLVSIVQPAKLYVLI